MQNKNVNKPTHIHSKVELQEDKRMEKEREKGIILAKPITKSS